MNITVTEKAAKEVKRIFADQGFEKEDKVYLRLRIVGGGCSGFMHKLDLTPDINEKLDNLFEVEGINVVIDKRSSLYADGVIVDYHSDLNKMGFSVTNSNQKSTCGCG